MGNRKPQIRRFGKKDPKTEKYINVTTGIFGETRVTRWLSNDEYYSLVSELASWDGGFITIRVVRNAK